MNPIYRIILTLTVAFACANGAERPKANAPINSQKESQGPLMVDPKWSRYPEYLQRLSTVVQIRWEREILGMQKKPEAGTRVVVRFELARTGKVSDLRVVSTDSDEAAAVCVAAINRGAPYSAWTENMIAVLGVKQEMTFSFVYQ